MGLTETPQEVRSPWISRDSRDEDGQEFWRLVSEKAVKDLKPETPEVERVFATAKEIGKVVAKTGVRFNEAATRLAGTFKTFGEALAKRQVDDTLRGTDSMRIVNDVGEKEFVERIDSDRRFKMGRVFPGPSTIKPGALMKLKGDERLIITSSGPVIQNPTKERIKASHSPRTEIPPDYTLKPLQSRLRRLYGAFRRCFVGSPVPKSGRLVEPSGKYRRKI